MNFSEEHAVETYKSLISISVEGLKTLLLINGGAVIAILTYIGNSAQGKSLASHVWWPLGFFVAGVCLVAFAFLSSYATQFFLYNETVSGESYKGPRHTLSLWVTVGIVILSLVSFTVGAFSSVCVFSRYASQ